MYAEPPFCRTRGDLTRRVNKGNAQLMSDRVAALYLRTPRACAHESLACACAPRRSLFLPAASFIHVGQVWNHSSRAYRGIGSSAVAVLSPSIGGAPFSQSVQRQAIVNEHRCHADRLGVSDVASFIYRAASRLEDGDDRDEQAGGRRHSWAHEAAACTLEGPDSQRHACARAAGQGRGGRASRAHHHRTACLCTVWHYGPADLQSGASCYQTL